MMRTGFSVSRGVLLWVSSDDGCYGCRFSVVGCIRVYFRWGYLFLVGDVLLGVWTVIIFLKA